MISSSASVIVSSDWSDSRSRSVESGGAAGGGAGAGTAPLLEEDSVKVA